MTPRSLALFAVEGDDIGDPDDVGGLHHGRGSNASGESRNMFGMEVDGPREKDMSK